MIRMGLKTICLSIFLFMFTMSHVEAKLPDTLLKQKTSVVTISVDDRNKRRIASGSGFIVDQDGIIVTNCRIIAKWIAEVGATLSVETEGGSRFPIEELISSKCENNLALLRIKAKGLPAVKLSPDYRPRPGESIVVIKDPSESEPAVTSGVIGSINEKNKSFQISTRVSPENSGSPLFNMKGEVVGALIVQAKKGKYLSFAVAIKDINKQLNRLRKPKKTIVESTPLDYKAIKEPEKKPENFREYYSRGCEYDRLNMYEEAIETYRQSIKINPDFEDAYINLGVDYYRLGKYDDAINAYKQALRIKPDLISAYNKLGSAYIIYGEYQMAIKTFKKAIDIDPNNASAHFSLGIAYFLNGDTSAALRECTTLRDIDKERADSLIDIIY
jgi:tetratricopeptide (TPR) repeat protein